MELFLIRHTTPDIVKGICYGQADIPLTASFQEEASVIQQYIPAYFGNVHSSPLRRCRQLAEHLFPAHTIQYHNELMEIHFGKWEMKSWDEIPRDEIGPWMNDFVNANIPEGESYVVLFDRVKACIDKIMQTDQSSAVITHGGVIRSILSMVTSTPLKESFNNFNLNYGCVVKLFFEGGWLHYNILSNCAPHTEELDKPGSFTQ